jgi:NIMA (never in mitosis gene a)-related kinase
MPPELFKNRPYAWKSDVWALGCVIYEIANFRPAFEGRNINGLAMKVMRGNYAPFA